MCCRSHVASQRRCHGSVALLGVSPRQTHGARFPDVGFSGISAPSLQSSTGGGNGPESRGRPEGSSHPVLGTRPPEPPGPRSAPSAAHHTVRLRVQPFLPLTAAPWSKEGGVRGTEGPGLRRGDWAGALGRSGWMEDLPPADALGGSPDGSGPGRRTVRPAGQLVAGSQGAWLSDLPEASSHRPEGQVEQEAMLGRGPRKGFPKAPG